MIGFRHLRLRARVSKGLEPFPSRNTLKRLLDYFMYVVGIAAPLAILPQIYEVYSTHNATGVSFLTWFFSAFFNVFWTLYASVHKDKHLFFASVLMALFALILVIGILMY